MASDTDAAEAYKDSVLRFMGEERPMRFVTPPPKVCVFMCICVRFERSLIHPLPSSLRLSLPSKGFFQRLFGQA